MALTKYLKHSVVALRVRLDALGIEAKHLSKQDLAPSNTAVCNLISAFKAIARALTVAEHQMMIDLGYAIQLPDHQNP